MIIKHNNIYCLMVIDDVIGIGLNFLIFKERKTFSFMIKLLTLKIMIGNAQEV